MVLTAYEWYRLVHTQIGFELLQRRLLPLRYHGCGILKINDWAVVGS
jgi:hypothetical protein